MQFPRSIAAVILSFAPCFPQSNATRPTFDVVSVKTSNSEWMETRPTRSGGRFAWTTDLHYLIGYAYDMQPQRISGPIPGSELIYRVEAMTDPSTSVDQIRLMLQSLLTDRFKMSARIVPKEANGFVLTVGKAGKLVAAKEGDPPAPMPEWARTASVVSSEGNVWAVGTASGDNGMTGRRVSMSQLAAELQRHLGEMVWDRTGMPGNYYFGFIYANPANPDSTAPSLGTALRESLGLKLEKGKGTVDMLVVDHLEKVPTDN
jgi:uncharacterized protein (TIGR03435 family)